MLVASCRVPSAHLFLSRRSRSPLGPVAVHTMVTSTSEELAPPASPEKRLKIYTRTGDKGVASLYNGERLPKDADFFQALGDVDELNSSLGVARAFCSERSQCVAEQLETIQSRLLDVGSAVATPLSKSSSTKLQRTRFDDRHVTVLEGWIDAMDLELPPLCNFILPSGGKAASFLHMSRSICRRAERQVVALTRQDLVDVQVGIYLNRLSDYLFTAARYVAMKEGEPEVVYKKAA